jgi:predicted ABC-type ATPase
MASSLEQPTIYVIGGPNGVGKTTFANEFLPHYVRCNEFLNADLIAAGLSPYMPESQNVRASQLMLERMQDLVSKRKTFAFETTLAARSYRQMILEWKELGYRIHLFFLWLPNPDMAVLRVANRVKQGGHNIPEHTIRQRYTRGIQNFQSLYRPIVDCWSCMDGSKLPPKLLAQSLGDTLEVFDALRWKQFQNATGTEQ